MFGNEGTLVAVLAGRRAALSLDRSRRLMLRRPDGQETVVESRPVGEFAGAVDSRGRLHVAVWLMSRQLFCLSSTDGTSFSRGLLLRGDTNLKLRDLLLWAGEEPAIAYVAETDGGDTLVCYRRQGDGWEGVRVAECFRPEQLLSLQADGELARAAILYAVRGGGQVTVLRRAADGRGPAEPIVRIQGGLNDFCALTDGSQRQACWVSDGALFINGVRHPGEAWQVTFPHFVRAVGSVQCQWLEGGAIQGVALGSRMASLITHPAQGTLPCRLALPGEVRRAIVDARTLQPIVCAVDPRPTEAPPLPPGDWGGPTQPYPAQTGATMAEAVRNQAIVLTRLQESVSALEHTTLRLQAEVTSLRKETTALLSAAGKGRSAQKEYNHVPVDLPAPRRPPDVQPDGGAPSTSDREDSDEDRQTGNLSGAAPVVLPEDHD